MRTPDLLEAVEVVALVSALELVRLLAEVDPEELEGTRRVLQTLTLPRLGGVGLIHACEERRVRYGIYSICGTMGPEETTDDIVCFLSFQVFVVGA